MSYIENYDMDFMEIKIRLFFQFWS